MPGNINNTERPPAGSITSQFGRREAPDYLKGLNDEQRLAVETIDGPLLVLAGAGTGKTRVLTTRIVHIINTNRAWPSQILSVTFTNKAAREMKERIEKLVPRLEAMPWMGTFHSIGARILRQHAGLVGLTSTFKEIVPDDRMVATEKFDEDWTGGETLVTQSLHDDGDGTILRTHILYASQEARDGAKMSGMTDGMEAGYARLDGMFAAAA